MKKKVLIVGGSSLIGKSLIKYFNKNSYKIYTTYNRNKISSNKFQHINQIKIDFNRLEDSNIEIKKLKNFDVIIFLSGIMKGTNLINFIDSEIHKIFKINVTSQIILLKKLLKLQKKRCTVVFISSVSGKKGSYDPIYASTKGAINALVKSISKWESPKIKCIGVCSGLIKNTKMYKTFKKNRLKKLKKENPNKEFVNADDLASIVYDLTKPHWRHSNGSLIDVNGGVY